MTTRTYTIKPLTWKEWHVKRYNQDGSAQIEVHYTADSIFNYRVVPLSGEEYSVIALSETSTGSQDFYDSVCTKSVEAAKDWCLVHLTKYLLHALEPVAVKGDGQ